MKKQDIFYILTALTILMAPLTSQANGEIESIKTGFIDKAILIKRAEQKKLSMPEPMKDGRVQTLNCRGAAIPFSNPFLKSFENYIKLGKKRVLHIEATFGHHVIRALDEFDGEYIASDQSIDHLTILTVRARNLLSQEQFAHLHIFYGSFPESYKEFPNEHFDAVLLNRVIHFYSPDEVRRTFKEIHRVLKPGGEVFIVAVTPYVTRFSAFIPLYKQRKLLKREYPGHLTNLKHFVNPEVTPPEQMDQLHDGEFMFFDAEVLHRILTENRFYVKKCYEFSIGFQTSTWTLDGRELVGAIARKPIPTALHDHLITTPADF